MTKHICISGYYGFDNFGDETILKILVENIKKKYTDSEITVFSSNPEKTANNLNVKSIKSFDIKKVINTLKHTDCLISGGGSLLQDATSTKSLLYYLFVILTAQFFRKKTIIFAQGIGPVNNKITAKLTAFAIKNSSYITVRDEKSLKLLQEWNINANICPDPVWNINIKNDIKTEKLGIQLREFHNLNDKFLKNFAQAIASNYYNREICLLSLQNTYDYNVCNKLKEYIFELNPDINVQLTENSSNEKVIEDISSLKELIAMRYHACLIGIKAGVKVLPISYDIKVETLAKEFNLNYIDLNNNENINKTIEEFKNNNIIYDTEKIKAKLFDFDNMLRQI